MMPSVRRALLVLLLLPQTVLADGPTPLEYKVKAVCLFNFAKYVKWPESVFKSETQPIRVCIYGRSPFGDIFQSKDAPKEAQNRPLNVVEVTASATETQLSECQLLYYQAEDNDAVSELTSILTRHSVLSVSDKNSNHSLIEFAVEDGKVRFKIRRKAAESLGIEVSSQLLKLAIIDD